MEREAFKLTYNKAYKNFTYIFIGISAFFTILAIWENELSLWIMAGMVYVGLLSAWGLSRSKSPVLLIDYEGICRYRGIWGNKKTVIKWSSISSFSTTFDIGADMPNWILILKLIDQKKIKIRYAYADSSMENIREAILFFSAGRKITDKGHRDYSPDVIDF
ncbi:MAG: hypothetical protein H7259_01790 [Cytophagales bacterium]|nr:hypothetical protein [Cytophaga sp.]